jgi:hypothetical protein
MGADFRVPHSRTNEMAHLRLPPDLIRAMDLCAVLWGTHRSGAAERLLREAVRMHEFALRTLIHTSLDRLAAIPAKEEAHGVDDE